MAHDRIEMRLYASLQKWKSPPVAEYELAGIDTVRDLLKESGIPEHEVAIVIVNGKRGQLDSVLQHGDSVSLFPLIGGG
jgi:molybdopterin synthase sulfur carrier subunit